MQPHFLRNPSGMSLDELYHYYTGCSNGLQMDCFDERFVDSKPALKSYLERGLVSPRKMIVLDSSPDARKYNKEKCALNVSEEEKLVKGWKKAQEMEHTVCVDLNGAYDALVDAKKSQSLTISHWKWTNLDLLRMNSRNLNWWWVIVSPMLTMLSLFVVLSIISGMRNSMLRIP